jgi:hypothetical protein
VVVAVVLLRRRRARRAAAEAPVPGPRAPRVGGARFRLEQFQDFLALEQGAADHTREAYARDVTRYVAFALTTGARAPASVDAARAARLRLPPQGPRARARVDPAHRERGPVVLPLPAR